MNKIIDYILHTLIVFLTIFLNYALLSIRITEITLTLVITIDICFIIGYCAYFYTMYD